jgi:hypothetical protein
VRALQVAKDIDLDAGSADGAAIDLLGGETPFLPGYTVVCAIAIAVWAEGEGVTTLALQTRSIDSGAWTTLATGDGNDPVTYTEVVLQRYIRYLAVGAGASDGRGSIHLLGN